MYVHVVIARALILCEGVLKYSLIQYCLHALVAEVPVVFIYLCEVKIRCMIVKVCVCVYMYAVVAALWRLVNMYIFLI